MLWHTALTYVVNEVLLEPDDPEWRFYFLLCIYGYESLRRSYRFAEVMSQCLLTMALRSGKISGDEARHLLLQLRERGLSAPSTELRATFMGDLDLAMTNPAEATVESMAHQFEDLALFQDFINIRGNVAIEDT